MLKILKNQLLKRVFLSYLAIELMLCSEIIRRRVYIRRKSTDSVFSP